MFRKRDQKSVYFHVGCANSLPAAEGTSIPNGVRIAGEPRPYRSGVGVPSAATEVDAFCRDSVSLADDERPRRYAFVSELPSTATGKKQHFVLRKQAPDDNAANLLVKP